MNSLAILLDSVIDYAGLFPPAGLDMAAAVRNYAAYRKGERSWALGRFVVPVSRLGEFEQEAREHLEQSSGGQAWKLTVLGGSDRSSDIERILEFNRRHGDTGSNSAVAAIDAIELKAGDAAEITRDAGVLHKQIETYFEVPVGNSAPPLIEAISRTGARAKVRTGGATPELVPSAADLARFLSLCAGAGVPFKATAGLHHPIRSFYQLTSGPRSFRYTMHGFLNLMFAAAFTRAGMSAEMTERVLGEEDVKAFGFASDGASWREHKLTHHQLLNARSEFVISFGSCSFEEPLDELKSFNLI